jgi:hypothetical protein
LVTSLIAGGLFNCSPWGISLGLMTLMFLFLYRCSGVLRNGLFSEDRGSEHSGKCGQEKAENKCIKWYNDHKRTLWYYFFCGGFSK